MAGAEDRTAEFPLMESDEGLMSMIIKGPDLPATEIFGAGAGRSGP